jgi:hypothetical protein
MNFVAIIGIVEKISEKEITVKVEKPEVKNDNENWFDLIDVEFENEELINLVKDIKTGDIVGIKGRARKEFIVGERLQIF